LPSISPSILLDSFPSQRPRSNLIVVASLIDRAPNLGGLARTCEIFGTENYVIDSLKLTENSEFKALSKTAEKWLKISEVKSWHLFDYLLWMKQLGYSIVGAEQSGKSVSLGIVRIPKKCVLLLG
jgi:tRNA guanosine-2'-O-methyltransferase